MPVIKLSQQIIDSQGLHCPAAGKRRVEYCDKYLPGLYIELRSSGLSTYYLRYKDTNGKTCHQKIGRTGDIALDEARQRAKILKAEITLGADPRADEKNRKSVLKMDDFFKDHYMPHAKVHKRTWKKDSELYELRLKQTFGNKKLNQIKRHEIQAFHVSLRDDGLSPAYADHFVKLLRRCLNLAVEWEMLEKNPAARIQLFNPDNRMENYLNEDELKRLLTVLRTDKKSPIPCLIAIYLLATGARLNTALQCKWRDIDRTGRVWRIPATNSKSKKLQSIPLNDSSIAVLDQLDTEGKHEYLFINRKTGKPYTTIHKVWKRLRAEAGLPHLRIHDLRHSAASYMAQAGISIYIIQQVLGHSDPSVTQRYAHLSTKNLHDAADCTSDVINAAMPELQELGPGT
jgi:integrase